MVKAFALQTRSSEQTGCPEPTLMTNGRGNLPAFPESESKLACRTSHIGELWTQLKDMVSTKRVGVINDGFQHPLHTLTYTQAWMHTTPWMSHAHESIAYTRMHTRPVKNVKKKTANSLSTPHPHPPDLSSHLTCIPQLSERLSAKLPFLLKVQTSPKKQKSPVPSQSFH